MAAAEYKVGEIVWTEVESYIENHDGSRNASGSKFVSGEITRIDGQDEDDLVRLATEEGIVTTLVGQIWK